MSVSNITRRAFLKGCCIVTGGLALSVHWTGRALAGARTIFDHMKERIAGVYREDKHFPRRASQENVQVQELYKKFLEKPLSEKSEHLLHTHWIDKSAAVKKLHAEGQYPGPRGGEFIGKKYPYEA